MKLGPTVAMSAVCTSCHCIGTKFRRQAGNASVGAGGNRLEPGSGSGSAGGGVGAGAGAGAGLGDGDGVGEGTGSTLGAGAGTGLGVGDGPGSELTGALKLWLTASAESPPQAAR